jgi:hypothetical protein
MPLEFLSFFEASPVEEFRKKPTGTKWRQRMKIT